MVIFDASSAWASAGMWLHANTRAPLPSLATRGAPGLLAHTKTTVPPKHMSQRKRCVAHTLQTKVRRKPYVTSALSQLQLESRATLNCFAEHSLTLFVQRVVSDV